MTKEEDITKNLTMIEYYKQQLDSIDAQLQYLSTVLAEYQRAKVTVEQLHAADPNTEVLIPLGGGTFVNGSVKDTSNVLIGVGASLVVEKSVDDALKKLDERIKKIQENQEKIVSIGQKIQCDAEDLSQKTQKMMEEAQR
jgi:prefoldin alpha subunit